MTKGILLIILFFGVGLLVFRPEKRFRKQHEYYLNVTTDSITVENVQSGTVYKGTYKDLDSLILIDNLYCYDNSFWSN